jgi:hypothetical protein
MDEKDSKVEQSSAAKTSRRDFLKGSAAIAGSALVGAAVKATILARRWRLTKCVLL